MYPALAVVDTLGPRADVLWVGRSGGIEAGLVQRAGYRLETVAAAGIHAVGLRALPGNLSALVRGTRQARRILRSFRPDAMLLTGGYVGVPAAVAGGGVPKVLIVPDVEPGLAARWMARLADVIAVATEESRSFYPAGARVMVTGYPTRPGLAGIDRAQARRRLGLEPADRVVLVLGGSLGARSINTALWAGLSDLTSAATLIHLTGAADLAAAETERASLPEDRRRRYRPFDYLHEDIGAAYAAADLAVGRAGASTLGELPLFGLPSLLVPYPHAWRYQRGNAAYLEQRGAAQVLADERLRSDLVPAVLALLSDPGRLAAMSTAARRQASPESAARIADLVEAAAGGAR